jgi:hypothetical protein
MNNPALTNKLNDILKLSNSSIEGYGAGIKTVPVNPTVKQSEVLTTNASLGTSGAKYVTEDVGTQVTIGNFSIITTAVQFKIFANLSSLTNIQVLITGVDQNNNEQQEYLSTNGTNGTTPVSTQYTYKCINDISLEDDGLQFTQTIYCSPVTGQDCRIILNGSYKINPFIMGCNKNGFSRRARLVGTQIQTPLNGTNFGLHVFNGNVAPSSSTGIWNVKLRILGVVSPITSPINFPSDGVVDLAPGELAVWYRETNNASATACNIQATWVFYYA